MANGNAVQRNGYVYIYDENNRQTACVPAGYGQSDGLKGYTNSSVNIQRGKYIFTFNEKGAQTGATPI